MQMNGLDEFLRPSFAPLNMDRYILRRGILRALQRELPRFSGVLLDIGCGFSPYRSIVVAPPSRVENYIGLDFADNIYRTPELTWDGKRIPLAENSVDCAMATEVLEHCHTPQTLLDETFRVLKPGGILFLTTPFVWPLHEVPEDYSRLTPFALDRLLTTSGFRALHIAPLGGWSASLAQLLGLWTLRRPAARLNRLLTLMIAYPLWGALLLGDITGDSSFGPNAMFCGLSATAVKEGGLE